jgi:cobalt/nickel transport system permease protein
LLVLMKKIKIPLILLLPIFLILPFTSGGKVLFSYSFLNLYESGMIFSFLICFKSISIMILFIILLSTSTFSTTARALRVLRFSGKLVDLILFSYRYIFIYMEDLRIMRTALALRGYKQKTSLHSIKSTIALIGTLMVRSFEQTDRLYQAMICRGYDSSSVSLNEFQSRSRDFLLSGILILISSIIFCLDYLI